jgi:hypothetical protein
LLTSISIKELYGQKHGLVSTPTDPLLTSISIKELYGQKHGLVCPQTIAKGMDPLEVARSQVVYRDTKTKYALQMHAFNWLNIDGNRLLHDRSLYEAVSPGQGYSLTRSRIHQRQLSA